jgi:hypothetical protein
MVLRNVLFSNEYKYVLKTHYKKTFRQWPHLKKQNKIFWSALRNAFFQDFTLDMYFRQFWRDPRLAFERRPNLDKLVVGAEYIKLIWVPDTFFVNEKTAYFHQATADNQFVRIFHSGEILRSIR